MMMMVLLVVVAMMTKFMMMTLLMLVTSDSDDGDGRWCLVVFQCYPPAYLPLGCSVGQCGLIITQNMSSCPARCSAQTTCASCLQTPHCGWCAINGLPNGGQGVCMEGGLLGPIYGQCSISNVSLGVGDPLPREFCHHHHPHHHLYLQHHHHHHRHHFQSHHQHHHHH